ncbi:Nucleic acid-binding, OB-fold containing protein [Parasponia andersonii]|uniref:Nucleic acid-binding, OB-fold containing protein n=1 Tax=Parasponia andersonii TaxID=3476 RepID=A0A2P5D5A3_PARAD|nr:Nucleic acid-binding, OB-fold containing protein [Parasponia andersonii]
MQVRVKTIQLANKNIAFAVVHERTCTIQCVVTVIPIVVSGQMVKVVSELSQESIINVQGIVCVTKDPITDATSIISVRACIRISRPIRPDSNCHLCVELQVRKLYCVNKALPTLFITIDNAALSDIEINKAKQVT